MQEIFERPEASFDSYMQRVKNYPRIDHAREIELSKIILHSKDQDAIDKAKEELITANLLLVVKQAQRYRNSATRYTLSFMDIIEEGNIGLMKAAARYKGDNDAKAKFGTFATVLIRQQITRGIHKSHIIRKPDNHHKIRWEINKLKKIHGDALTGEIIMQELDITENYLKLVESCNIAYLETLGFKDENGEQTDWQDWLGEEDADQTVDKKSLLSYLRTKMATVLSDREKNILFEYYFDGEDRTLTDIGDRYGITRERVRQILAKATRKLRNDIVSEWNKDHEDNEEDKIDDATCLKIKRDTYKQHISRRDCTGYDENDKSKIQKIVDSFTLGQ